MLLKLLLSALILASATGVGILLLDLWMDRMDFDDWSNGRW